MHRHRPSKLGDSVAPEVNNDDVVHLGAVDIHYGEHVPDRPGYVVFPHGDLDSTAAGNLSRGSVRRSAREKPSTGASEDQFGFCAKGPACFRDAVHKIQHPYGGQGTAFPER